MWEFQWPYSVHAVHDFFLSETFLGARLGKTKFRGVPELMFNGKGRRLLL